VFFFGPVLFTGRFFPCLLMFPNFIGVNERGGVGITGFGLVFANLLPKQQYIIHIAHDAYHKQDHLLIGSCCFEVLDT
jgi:hypothetical protein